MSTDISSELNIIRNTLRGEDVRDAVVSAFRKVKATSLGVVVTKADFDSLSYDEKNNGTLYFISDIDIDYDENDRYFITEENVDSYSAVLVSHDLLKRICDKIRNYFSISGGIRLSDVPTYLELAILSASVRLVSRLDRVIVPSYVSTSSSGYWYYRSISYPSDYVTDLYSVKKDHTYLVVNGSVVGGIFRAAIFETNPFTVTSNLQGVTGQYVTSEAGARIVISSSIDGYLAVTLSNNANENASSHLIDITELP